MLFSNYWYKQGRRRLILEQAAFFVGVALTVGAPEYFYSLYRGSAGFAIFGLTSLVGTALGIIRYYYSPFQIIRPGIKAALPRNPSNIGSSLKWAA